MRLDDYKNHQVLKNKKEKKKEKSLHTCISSSTLLLKNLPLSFACATSQGGEDACARLAQQGGMGLSHLVEHGLA